MSAVIRRTLFLLILLGVIFISTRAIVRALPGDPAETIIAESGTSFSLEALRQELRLDLPFKQALIEDARSWLKGDLGSSLITRAPVRTLLIDTFTNTLLLTALSLLLSLTFSLALGVHAATRQGQLGEWSDRFCTAFGALSAAVPIPWMGPLLAFFFSVVIPIAPAEGSVFLPAFVLALSISGTWSRLIRERVREVLRRGPADAARARGVPEFKIGIKYGLAPASGALLAYLGTQLGGLLAGAFVVEVIFGWKGIGVLLVEAVLRRDYPIIEAATFVASACVLGGSALGDFLQWSVDPRLRTLLEEGDRR